MSLSFIDSIELYISFAVICVSIVSIISEILSDVSIRPTVLQPPEVHLELHCPFIGRCIVFLLSLALSTIVFLIFYPIVNSKLIFVLFYLLAPSVFSIALFLDGINDFKLGVFLIAKGFFYACFAFISLMQIIFVEQANYGKLALGFTLSLALFETITAVFDGSKWIREGAPEQLNDYFKIAKSLIETIKSEKDVGPHKSEEMGQGPPETETSVEMGGENEAQVVEGYKG